MKEIFVKWLKLNNCYEQYIVNFSVQENWHGYKSLDEFFMKCYYTDYMFVFSWRKTKEGSDYWVKMHNKWANLDNHIKQINNKYYYFKHICKLEKL